MKWVTRARPKTDRIACPWLIRKFIDPEAEILYVPTDQVLTVAEREGGHGFDTPGAKYDHRDSRDEFHRCGDVIGSVFGTRVELLQRFAGLPEEPKQRHQRCADAESKYDRNGIERYGHGRHRQWRYWSDLAASGDRRAHRHTNIR